MNGSVTGAPPKRDPQEAGEGGRWPRLAAGSGPRMHALVSGLFPLDRSLTGEGVRETLRLLGELIPLTLHEVPSGTEVLDWTVPREWNVREAYIRSPDGRRIADFNECNLHLVGYSVPVRERMPLDRLRPHLHSIPEQPDRIPFRTSYYDETWGFCLSHRELATLPEGEYEVVVDATLTEGSLTYGDLHLPGELPDEVLVSSHVCHPSLANDNLSGVVVAAHLARVLAGVSHRLSYRFVFAPATIGALAWLAKNRGRVDRIRHGLVLSCLGDPGPLTYKKSRQGTAPVDRAAALVLRHRGAGERVREFEPFGYDERQYCSPGFDLPVGRLSRTPHGEFPEYHTSGDSPDLVTSPALEESLEVLLEILEALERDRVVENLHPHGEPQLGRRGLYRSLGGEADLAEMEAAFLWVLNLGDGHHSLVDVAVRAGLPFHVVDRAAGRLAEAGLLRFRSQGTAHVGSGGRSER